MINLTDNAKRLRANRSANKQWAIEYKGGKCESCGLVPEHLVLLEFHHNDMNEKEFNINPLSWGKRKKK